MLEAVTFGLLIAFIRRQQLGGYVRCNWRSLLGGGIAAAGAYGLVIYVMNSNTIVIVAALRETSVVMAALIGARLLRTLRTHPTDGGRDGNNGYCSDECRHIVGA